MYELKYLWRMRTWAEMLGDVELRRGARLCGPRSAPEGAEVPIGREVHVSIIDLFQLTSHRPPGCFTLPGCGDCCAKPALEALIQAIHHRVSWSPCASLANTRGTIDELWV